MDFIHSRPGTLAHSGGADKVPGVVARVAAAISDDAAKAATAERQLTQQQVVEVDAREEVLMAAHSPDGTPPEHWLRRAEWRWFRYVMIALALCTVAGVAVSGVSGGQVLMGLALLAIMGFAAAPVWGAAILRARETREARAEAIAEIQKTGVAGGISPGYRHLQTGPDIQVICVKEDSNV